MEKPVKKIRYRESLETRNWQEALQKERDRLVEIAQGKIGAHGPAGKQTLNSAADDYIEERKLHSAEKTFRTDKERCKALRKAFGYLLIKKFTGKVVGDFQKSGSEAGKSGRTINLEVGLLRRILKKNKQWARIADEVRMLPEQPKEARVLTP